MSYCRFSTDNFCCDVYCYADVSGGITIHVAGNRFVAPAPNLDLLTATEASLAEYNRWLRDPNKVRVPIKLPHAGESFWSVSAENAVHVLKALKELGYQFPESVIPEIEEDVRTERQNEI